MFCEELLQQNKLLKFSCETRFDYSGNYDRAKLTMLKVRSFQGFWRLWQSWNVDQEVKYPSLTNINISAWQHTQTYGSLINWDFKCMTYRKYEQVNTRGGISMNDVQVLIALSQETDWSVTSLIDWWCSGTLDTDDQHRDLLIKVLFPQYGH